MISYFTKDEIGRKIFLCYERNGRRQIGPIAVHRNSKCRVDGFVGIGPWYQGRGISWFDIKDDKELKQIVREVCGRLGLNFVDKT
jgi:hypothetical protein